MEEEAPSFDEFTYLALYEDLWEASKVNGFDAAEHYTNHGAREGRHYLVDALWTLKNYDLRLVQALSIDGSAIRNFHLLASDDLPRVTCSPISRRL